MANAEQAAYLQEVISRNPKKKVLSMRSLTTNTSSIFYLILLFVLSVSTATAQSERPSGVTKTDTVYVAYPTGERETDRASILAAIEEVKSGGTVQFAQGMYLMGGEIIRITVPRVTITGHPVGTTLRGCYPDEFQVENIAEFGDNCNGLELAGGWQTVRNLTFEHFFWALLAGCCWDSRPHMMPGEGGHLIEDNTFRSNSNAVRVHGYWSEPTVIRNNLLLNNWHSVSVYGNTAHILDNLISAPEPEEVQGTGFPADGIHIGHPMELHESADSVMRSCENNIVSDNRIEGVTEGIMMTANDPEITCRNNVIRGNTIAIRRAHPPVMPGFIRIHDESDSTVVGVPLALRGSLEENLIEGNNIHGAEGLAIEIRGASRNRIVNNMISGVAPRKPFPGNAIAALPIIGGDPETWREANGSGIWVSSGSNGNEIMGNVFEDIASYAVFVEGDSNRVEVRDLEDDVRDLGSGNRLIISNENKETEKIESRSESKWSDPSPHKIHYVTVAPGVQLEVLDWGGSGETLVFLAGLQMNAHAFDDFAPRFTDSHRAVGITRRGHGASSWPDDDYSLERLVEDIRIVLDTLGVERVILAGHSMAGMEITHFASEYPERVAGLVYIDAGHDLTLIEGHGLMAVCPMGPEILGAIEKRFDNPNAFNHTQKHVAPDGTLIPFVSNNAVARLFAGFTTPDYSAVRAPALAVYDTPRQIEDVFGGETDLSPECISAMQRYIYEGIAGFAVGMERAWIVAINDSHHNLHLVSPDTLEEVMRRWLADLPE
jgi:pimeloyl-ACP methyl ester carboxylesterase